MPNLPAHIHLASQAAARLEHPVVNSHMGSFLLGSTSPDIRALTKWPRDRTHFAPLAIDRVGTGVEGMFSAHPRLQQTSALNEPTRAFVAGYMNHLVADESWILHVYRPCFDDHDGSGNKVQCDIWDRALQLDMDRQARVELDNMAQVLPLLDGADEGVEVGFLSGETLAQWRAWVQEFNTWEFSWDRLHRAVRRMYGDDPQAGQLTQQFIQEMPDSLERAYEQVSTEGLVSYREGTVRTCVEFMKEYLDAPAGNRGAGES